MGGKSTTPDEREGTDRGAGDQPARKSGLLGSLGIVAGHDVAHTTAMQVARARFRSSAASGGVEALSEFAARGRASAGERTHASGMGAPRASLIGGRGWGADALILVGAYLYGSLPLVYALGRERNVDLKRVGSGNVGATNLMSARGPLLAALGWIFDASKGLLPVLAARRMRRDAQVAELAGVCGVAGQCWPLFLRFQGGRGISAYVGATAAISPRAWPAALLPMIVGGLWRVGGRYLPRRGDRPAARPARSKSMPLACLVSMVTYPLARGVLDRRGARGMVAPSLLSLVVIARRLTAALPDDATDGPAAHPKALLFRLLYDRNTSV